MTVMGIVVLSAVIGAESPNVNVVRLMVTPAEVAETHLSQESHEDGSLAFAFSMTVSPQMKYWAELSGTTESGDSARFKAMWTFSFWLRDAFNRNLPYDKFVRAVVAGKGGSIQNPAMTFATNQLPKVETVPQLFLGIRLRCAQCHDMLRTVAAVGELVG